jgi:hypothetical protein
MLKASLVTCSLFWCYFHLLLYGLLSWAGKNCRRDWNLFQVLNKLKGSRKSDLRHALCQTMPLIAASEVAFCRDISNVFLGAFSLSRIEIILRAYIFVPWRAQYICRHKQEKWLGFLCETYAAGPGDMSVIPWRRLLPCQGSLQKPALPTSVRRTLCRQPYGRKVPSKYCGILSISPVCALLLVKRQPLNVLDVDVYCAMKNIHGIPTWTIATQMLAVNLLSVSWTLNVECSTV